LFLTSGEVRACEHDTNVCCKERDLLEGRSEEEKNGTVVGEFHLDAGFRVSFQMGVWPLAWRVTWAPPSKQEAKHPSVSASSSYWNSPPSGFG